MGDGRKVKLKIPGLEPPAQPDAGDDRAAPEPLRDEPPTPTHPDVDPAAGELCGELHRRLLEGVEEVNPHRGLDGTCEPVRRLDDRLIAQRGGRGQIGSQPVDES